MSIYIQAAKDKFYSDRSVNYYLPFKDFVCECYVKLTPNSYGSHIQNKLIQDLNLIEVPASENRGDFSCCNKYFEFKVSFFSKKTESYCITHIRPWQNLEYYVLCFVDCAKDFTPNFYVLDKSVISQLKTGYMNGTPESNKNNTNIELRATVNVNSDNMSIIRNANLLENTSLECLSMFFTSMRNEDEKQRYIKRLKSFKNFLLSLRDENSPYFDYYLDAYGLKTIEDCDELVLSMSECA
jgi:hypothetical protein